MRPHVALSSWRAPRCWPANWPKHARVSLDQVGLGDLAASAGDWQGAAGCYRRAHALDGSHPLVRIALAQVRIAAGDVRTAVAELDRMVGQTTATGQVADPAVRHYLATALLATADQARSLTKDGTPVITSRRQLDTCGRLADQILALGVDSPDVTGQARLLRDTVEAGRRWTWQRRPAVLYGAITVLIGLAMVITGGLLGSVALVIAGVAVGSTLIFWIVTGYRREAWRRSAEHLAPVIWRRGVSD
jgi:hypothetical protein